MEDSAARTNLAEVTPCRYGGVATAAGVVYTISNLGTVMVNRASNGLPITQLPLIRGGAIDTIALTSSGVAIARNTVYAAAGSHIVAYRVPQRP